MELTLSTPALLFSTVSLLMIAFTNRFLAIANLVRDLHQKFKENSKDELVITQIKQLHYRMGLIRTMQIVAILSLILSAVCMLLLFVGLEFVSRWVFTLALLLQIWALIISVWEIRLSMDSLKVELSDMSNEL
jgi:Protein of unknown function (DUF2721)